jgi:lipopolysaccharide transport system permease protein
VFSSASPTVTRGCRLLLLAVLMGFFSLGMIISSLVTKYRDFTYLISFGVQLLMYVSAVVYPIALVQEKCQNMPGW